MLTNTFKGFALFLGLIFIVGCTTTKNIEFRRYVKVKDRVDQNMESGNAGFVAGTPVPEDRSNIKKTRKVYVLELSTGEPVEGSTAREQVAELENKMKEETAAKKEELEEAPEEAVDEVIEEVVEEVVEEIVEREEVIEVDEPASPLAPIEYKVQKDDTLQKISKKFYDSFSEWPRIYDANRDVIDNPDQIKPGIVIQIPLE